MAKPVQLDVDTGSDNSSIKTDTSPTSGEKRRFPHSDGGGSEKENHPRGSSSHRGGGGMQRAGSKELKRQFSMADRERTEGGGGRAPMERGRSLDREMTGSSSPHGARGGGRGGRGRFMDDYGADPMMRGGGRGGRGHHTPDGRIGRGGGGGGYPGEMSPHGPPRQSRRPDDMR